MADLEKIDQQLNDSIDNIKSSWEEMKGLVNSVKQDADTEYQKLKVEYDKLNSKYLDAQTKLDHIEGQLNETVERLESMSKATSKGVDAMKLLDVYLVLMEQVFESGPHVRLLLILHGDKEEWQLDELVAASGISGIQVRQAMMELRNSGVLEYDDDTQKVKLLQRFL